MIALGKRPGLICKGAEPVDVYVGGHPVTPGITLEDYPLQEATGSVVTCEPITGYKLGVTSQITAVQDGTGDPSPDNVRPIVGWDSVTLTHNGQTHTRALPETVYGGTLDWRTGLLTVTHARCVVTGAEKWNKSNLQEVSGIIRYDATISDYAPTAEREAICSHYPYNGINRRGCWCAGNDKHLLLRIHWSYDSVDKLQAYLADQYAAGTPVQVVYKLATPYTIQLTPQQLIALAGTNTLYSNSGDTAITYRIRKT